MWNERLQVEDAANSMGNERLHAQYTARWMGSARVQAEILRLQVENATK